MREALGWTASQIAARVRSGEVSAVSIFGAFLERSQELEPRLGAYLEIFADDGMAQAREVDRRCAAGEELGSLAGVPVAIKDNIAMAGRQQTCGSKILQGYVSPYSAAAVERLEGADAILFGRCNMDEFAMGSSCENSALGETRNPWNLGRVPGGSSGGPAAAVATGVPLSLGSDTGGSIRQPAAFCGVVGLKPTYGRVPRYGLVAFTSSTDQIGPIARNVEDAALGLSVIAGQDPRDATSVPGSFALGRADLAAGLEGLRIGVLEEVAETDLGTEMARSWRGALEHLEDLGAELVPISIPALEAAIPCYYLIATSEASANLARFDGVRFGHRAQASGSLRELYERSRSEGFGTEVKRRIMLGTFALSSGYYEAYYGRAQAARRALRAQFAAAFQCVDALVTPTAPTGAFAVGERVEDPLSMYLSDIYTVPASLVGIPALSVPCGKDPDGLPLGLQIMAKPLGEATTLRIGQAFEGALGWKVEPDLVDS